MAINLPRLEADISEQHQKRPFSGVIFIRENNEPLLAKGFGFANKAEAIANTLDTRFGIASGAKIFTAVAIGQLVEKGLLAFDSLFKDCVNISFPEFDPTITIHQLLTHSSGVPDYFDEEVMDDYEALWKERPMYGFRTPGDFVPLIQNHPMKFAPGTRWSYNNAGFILLGLVVEYLSGQSFTVYVEEHIFAVAGMNDTGYFAMDRLPARTAYGYIRDGVDGWRTNIYAVPVIGGPDGGVFTTALDIGKFWDSLLDNRLMNKTTTAQMLFPHLAAETQGANIYYGYGVYMTKQDENIVAFSVEGGDPGVVFYSVIYPEKKILLTILGNTTSVGWLTKHVVEPIRNA